VQACTGAGERAILLARRCNALRATNCDAARFWNARDRTEELERFIHERARRTFCLTCNVARARPDWRTRHKKQGANQQKVSWPEGAPAFHGRVRELLEGRSHFTHAIDRKRCTAR
jgi:hypothetical protein